MAGIAGENRRPWCCSRLGESSLLQRRSSGLHYLSPVLTKTNHTMKNQTSALAAFFTNAVLAHPFLQITKVRLFLKSSWKVPPVSREYSRSLVARTIASVAATVNGQVMREILSQGEIRMWARKFQSSFLRISSKQQLEMHANYARNQCLGEFQDRGATAKALVATVSSTAAQGIRKDGGNHSGDVRGGRVRNPQSSRSVAKNSRGLGGIGDGSSMPKTAKARHGGRSAAIVSRVDGGKSILVKLQPQSRRTRAKVNRKRYVRKRIALRA